MKNAMIIAALLLGSVAMAEGSTSATGAKLSKKEARKECLKDNKELKGAKLSDCVKEKVK